MLPLHDKAQRLLATWVKIIWPKLPKKGSNNVSLQSDGSSFHGWTIGRSLPEIWRKSFVCLDLRVTAIDIRWWIVNTTHEKKTQGASFDECNLRRKMCHSHKTSRCYYLTANPTEVANRGLDIIIQCTNIDPKPNAGEEGDKSADQQCHVDINNKDHQCLVEEQHQASSTIECTGDKAHDAQHCQSNIGNQSLQSETQRPLTSMEKSIIAKVFKDLINSNDRVEIEEVRYGMRHTEQLRLLLMIQGMDVKVAGRIRHLQTQTTVESSGPSEVLSLPDKQQLKKEWTEITTNSIISPTTVSTKKAWDIDDTKTIEASFTGMNKCP